MHAPLYLLVWFLYFFIYLFIISFSLCLHLYKQYIYKKTHQTRLGFKNVSRDIIGRVNKKYFHGANIMASILLLTRFFFYKLDARNL